MDVATVNDFLNSFVNRFNPVLREHRNNKKFCNAVAEAIALAQPSLANLDRKLNITVAKLLITKFFWNLEGLAVYQGGKLIVICSNSNSKNITNAISRQCIADECNESNIEIRVDANTKNCLDVEMESCNDTLISTDEKIVSIEVSKDDYIEQENITEILQDMLETIKSQVELYVASSL